MTRIFIGTSTKGEDDPAEKALEHSLRKNASEEIEITFMRNNNDPQNPFAGFSCKSWATPFSGLRWVIPEVCNFEGRAIYMDVDQLNLHDITKLFNVDLKGKTLGSAHGRTCVMVMDCEKFKSIHVPMVEMKKDARNHMRLYGASRAHGITQSISDKWNVLDGRRGEKIEDIYHLHFTTMSTQPWRPAWAKVPHKKHPRQDLVKLWEQYRDEAYALES